MAHTNLILSVAVLSVMAAGCSSAGSTNDVPGAAPEIIFAGDMADGSRTTEVVIGAKETVDDITVDYAVKDGAGSDLPATDQQAGPDTPSPALCAEPGGFGCPCNGGADCNEGWCVDSWGGQICTTGCVEECPDGFDCVQVGNATDQVFLCLPAYLWLCRPCTHSEQCIEGLEADTGDKCVLFGAQGAFCGGKCVLDEDCPQGFECAESENTEGGFSSQCIPADGICQCTAKATEEGSSTECSVENEFGSCPGQRSCTPAGLTDCDAQVPVQEDCNGIDDNCNELIDEELPEVECVAQSSLGVCQGLFVCVDAKWECNAAQATDEVCDGEDNNCNGEVDENFIDTDADGKADCVDPDDDDDQVLDESDNCPLVANPEQTNSDDDSEGDLCDDDDDGDLDPDSTDCQPLNPLVHHLTLEDCKTPDDDNCNGSTNEENGVDCVPFYPDVDEDGFGGPDPACLCEPLGDYVLDAPGDCNDQDGGVHPEAEETCSTPFDDNCDGLINDVTAVDCVDLYLDEDQDGFGSGAPECLCQPKGKVTASKGNDCNDLLGTVYPGAFELCDGVDNNCNDVVDEQHLDSDLDGDADCIDEDDDNDGTLDLEDCQPYNPAVPACGGKECGGDGCGGSCGTCPGGTQCVNFHCSCQSDCAGKQCGDDGCGGDCGTCPNGYVCTNGHCNCLSQCAGKQCGSDGCGGSCGTCPQGYTCNVSGQCQALPNPCGNITWTGQCIGDVLQFCHAPGSQGSPCNTAPVCQLASGDCNTQCFMSGHNFGFCECGFHDGICWPYSYCCYCSCY
jgi:hypothetical protein